MATDTGAPTTTPPPAADVPFLGGETVRPLAGAPSTGPASPASTGATNPDPTTPGAMTSSDASAMAQISGFLGAFGLADLGAWAWAKWQNNESVDQIMLELRSTPQYKTRFPAMEELGRQGRAINETDYIGYESTVRQLIRAAGLPAGMYDTPAGIADLLVKNVSPNEVKGRLDIAQFAAYQAPQAVRDAMHSYYGAPPSQGDLTGYYLDEAKALPLLQQQAAAAQIGGAGAQQGLGIDRATAENLAAQGVSYSQALTGLGAVAQTQALGAGPGEQASQSERIGAQFGDASAAAAVGRVIRGRLAAGQGGGGAAAGQQGVAGLGTSARQP